MCCEELVFTWSVSERCQFPHCWPCLDKPTAVRFVRLCRRTCVGEKDMTLAPKHKQYSMFLHHFSSRMVWLRMPNHTHLSRFSQFSQDQESWNKETSSTAWQCTHRDLLSILSADLTTMKSADNELNVANQPYSNYRIKQLYYTRLRESRMQAEKNIFFIVFKARRTNINKLQSHITL